MKQEERLTGFAGKPVVLAMVFLAVFAACTGYAANRDDLMKFASTNMCPNCDLSGADLSARTTRAAYLSNANLSGANLSGADLTNSNLSGANLSGTNLYRANLSGANLSKANLTGANLSGASLSDVNLSGAKLSNATWTDGTKCKEPSAGSCDSN